MSVILKTRRRPPYTSLDMGCAVPAGSAETRSKKIRIKWVYSILIFFDLFFWNFLSIRRPDGYTCQWYIHWSVNNCCDL